MRCASARVICDDKRNNGEVYKQRVREQSKLSARDEQGIGLANRKQRAIINRSRIVIIIIIIIIVIFLDVIP